jgi:hypothetical protein
MKRSWTGCLLVLAAVLALTATAVPAVAAPGSLHLPISLPLGLSGDLTVSFDDVTGLSPASLGVSYQLVSPLDPALLARLPQGVGLLVAFPVLVRIEPPAAGGLSFTGAGTVDLGFLSLANLQPSPLRLYKAPVGGSFADVTNGSQHAKPYTYRSMGAIGGFSEFLIVLDLTPTSQAIQSKLDRLDGVLSDNAGAIAPAVLAELTGEVAAARADVAAGDLAAAEADVDDLLATVAAHQGTDIPDVWRATRDLVDVAGLLVSGGETLRFSLEQALGQ